MNERDVDVWAVFGGADYQARPVNFQPWSDSAAVTTAEIPTTAPRRRRRRRALVVLVAVVMLAVTAVVAGAFVAGSATEPSATTVDASSTEQVTDCSAVVQTRELSLGASGDDVACVQLRLIELGFLARIDGPAGVFDEATRLAVVAFQTSAGRTADGVVGPLTAASLDLNYQEATP